jgi:hypothetical protein
MRCPDNAAGAKPMVRVATPGEHLTSCHRHGLQRPCSLGAQDIELSHAKPS